MQGVQNLKYRPCRSHGDPARAAQRKKWAQTLCSFSAVCAHFYWLVFIFWGEDPGVGVKPSCEEGFTHFFVLSHAPCEDLHFDKHIFESGVSLLVVGVERSVSV